MRKQSVHFVVHCQTWAMNIVTVEPAYKRLFMMSEWKLFVANRERKIGHVCGCYPGPIGWSGSSVYTEDTIFGYFFPEIMHVAHFI
jgi:hypothetical protein